MEEEGTQMLVMRCVSLVSLEHKTLYRYVLSNWGQGGPRG